MNNLVNLKVRPEDKQNFEMLARKLDRPYWRLFADMANYFKRTGYDPADKAEDEVKQEMAKLRKTLVSFVRQQEQKILLPISSKVDELVMALPQMMRQLQQQQYAVLEEEPAEDKAAKQSSFLSTEQEEQARLLQAREEEIIQLKIALERSKKAHLRMQDVLRRGQQKRDSFLLKGMNQEIEHYLSGQGAYQIE